MRSFGAKTDIFRTQKRLKVFDEIISVAENRKINQAYWKLSFVSPKLVRSVLPGQFLNVQLSGHSDPLLRRPFSYYRVSGSRIEILYTVLGRGTSIMSGMKKGDTLKILGPLGKPFTGKLSGKKRVLIAGGIGVPPLVFLAEKFPSAYLLIGCKSKGEVLPKREFAKTKAKILYATEDGSFGRKGLVVDLFQDLAKKEDPKLLFIQTCGPSAMMKAVMNLAFKFGIQGEASMDERMACGIGACLGCMVKTKEGYKTSCVDGPVFRFEDLEV